MGPFVPYHIAKDDRGLVPEKGGERKVSWLVWP